MKTNTIWTTVIGLLLVTGFGSAETTKVKRSVGPDGVPVLKIKGNKAVRVSLPAEEPSQIEAPSEKAFRVYELDGESSESQQKPTVVLVGYPPPISPNPAAYGYGWGYPNWGYPNCDYPVYATPYGRGYYGPGHRGQFYNGGVGVGYQNYQNPPINYQNPPANYRPINSGFNGYRGYSRCR
jgi:hypothetical protein